jgi:hypothetical protein
VGDVRRSAVETGRGCFRPAAGAALKKAEQAFRAYLARIDA